MSWIDQFLTAIGFVQDAGTPLIQRPTINFVLPPGGSVVDDPTTKVTTVTVPVGAGLNTLAPTGNPATNVNNINTAFATAPDVYYGAGVFTVTPSATIGSNGYVHHIPQNSGISVSSGTVTVAGTIVAGDYQIFFGGGLVALPDMQSVNAAWWGMPGNGVADDVPAVNAAVAVLGTRGGTVQIPPGSYSVKSSMQIGEAGVQHQGIVLRSFATNYDGGTAGSTFRAISSLTGGRAMLEIVDTLKSRVLGIDFDANGNADACINVRAPFQPTVQPGWQNVIEKGTVRNARIADAVVGKMPAEVTCSGSTWTAAHGHSFTIGDEVWLIAPLDSWSLPRGFVRYLRYFVRQVSGSTFKLATTNSDGTIVTASDTGAGRILCFGLDFGDNSQTKFDHVMFGNRTTLPGCIAHYIQQGCETFECVLSGCWLQGSNPFTAYAVTFDSGADTFSAPGAEIFDPTVGGGFRNLAAGDMVLVLPNDPSSGDALPGAFTSIASGSNGADAPGDGGSATINVTSTAAGVGTIAFPASGSVAIRTSIGLQTITYTGKSGTTLTGCAGGHGKLYTGQPVYCGITPDTELWVLGGGQLAASPGGAAIDIPAGGSGTYSLMAMAPGPYDHILLIEGTLRTFGCVSAAAYNHLRGRGRPSGSVASLGSALTDGPNSSQNWRRIDYDTIEGDAGHSIAAPQSGGVYLLGDHEHVGPPGGPYDGIRYNGSNMSRLEVSGTNYGNTRIGANVRDVTNAGENLALNFTPGVVGPDGTAATLPTGLVRDHGSTFNATGVALAPVPVREIGPSWQWINTSGVNLVIDASGGQPRVSAGAGLNLHLHGPGGAIVADDPLTGSDFIASSSFQAPLFTSVSGPVTVIGNTSLTLEAAQNVEIVPGTGFGTYDFADTHNWGNHSQIQQLTLSHSGTNGINLAWVYNGDVLTTTPTKFEVVVNSVERFVVDTNGVGFNGGAGVIPAITGALSTVVDPAAKAVLTSIIAALKSGGVNLVTDGTT